MKPAAIALPVLTLLACGIWLGSQHRSISALEQQSAVLKKRIAAHDATPLAVSAGASQAPREKKGVKPVREKTDWKGVADELVAIQRQGGVSNMRTMLRFQQKIQEMTADELVAALDEIAALDLPKESVAMLEQAIIGPLAKKDPEMALNRFADRLNERNGMLGWALSEGMKEWCKKDTAAATAWLDQQIAGGKFDSKSLDGKSPSRSMFEGQVIIALLAKDPDAASVRLATLPESQRQEAMRIVSSPLKEEQQVAFANMAREHLPEEEQTTTLAQVASQIASTRDYADVSSYIERISATPEERTAIVTAAASDKLRSLSYNEKITQEQVDQMRDWALSNSANDANKITGKALAQVADYQNPNNNFNDLADLAVHYHEASGNDEVMTSFLQNSYLADKEKARELAEKISDPQRREEILKRYK